MARRAGPGPGRLLRRLLRRRGGSAGSGGLEGGEAAERAASRLAGIGLPGWDLPGGTMRVAKWLTGLLYQLSLFITRSWEVHFHPRQGKVTARRLRQLSAGSGPSGTAGRSWGSEQLSPLGNPGSAGAPRLPDQSSSQASPEVAAASGFWESCSADRTPSPDHAVGARGAEWRVRS